MAQFRFRNFQLLEPEADELQGGFELLIEGDIVKAEKLSDLLKEARELTAIFTASTTTIRQK